MNHICPIVASGMALLLSACMGSSAGSGTNSDDSDTDITVTAGPDFSETLAVTANYVPVYDDDTSAVGAMLRSDVAGDGISGFVGLRDGTIAPFVVRISADENTAYLSIDGAEEIALTNRQSLRANNGRWDDGTQEVFVFWDDDTLGIVLDDSLFGEGWGGLRTPIEDLPTGAVAYAGNFVAYDNSNNDLEGYLGLNVDFGAGGVDGVLVGTAETGAGDQAFFGNIVGEIDDGLFVGRAAESDGSVDFDLDMLGAVYNNGVELNGAIAGTFNGTTVGGDFGTDVEGSGL